MGPILPFFVVVESLHNPGVGSRMEEKILRASGRDVVLFVSYFPCGWDSSCGLLHHVSCGEKSVIDGQGSLPLRMCMKDIEQGMFWGSSVSLPAGLVRCLLHFL